MSEHPKVHLKGKAIILGIDNTLYNDDGRGLILASYIKNRIPCTMYYAGPNPESYLGKITHEKPDNIIIINAPNFYGKPGNFEEIKA